GAIAGIRWSLNLLRANRSWSEARCASPSFTQTKQGHPKLVPLKLQRTMLSLCPLAVPIRLKMASNQPRPQRRKSRLPSRRKTVSAEAVPILAKEAALRVILARDLANNKKILKKIIYHFNYREL